MSTGRQGSNSQPQQLHLEGQRRGARGGGVDAGAEALEQGAQLGVERRRLALGDAADAERAHQPVDRQPLLPGHLGDPALDRRGGRSPSARAGPGRGRSPGRSRGRARRRPRRGARPSGRGAPAPGPPAPRARSCPRSSAAAAAPASARPPRSPRRRARSPPARQGQPAPRHPGSTPHSDCLSSMPAGPASPSLSGYPDSQVRHAIAQARPGPPAAAPRPRAFRGGPPSPSPPSAAARPGCRPRPRRAGRRGSARRARGRRAGGARASRGARRTRRASRRGR